MSADPFIADFARERRMQTPGWLRVRVLNPALARLRAWAYERAKWCLETAVVGVAARYHLVSLPGGFTLKLVHQYADHPDVIPVAALRGSLNLALEGCAVESIFSGNENEEEMLHWRAPGSVWRTVAATPRRRAETGESFWFLQLLAPSREMRAEARGMELDEIG